MRLLDKHLLCILRVCVSFLLLTSLQHNQEALAVSSWLFTSEHDLPNSLINDLVEDADGNIWIATEDGLCRYNGSSFATYRTQPDNRHSLSNNLVRCLFVDREGHLFVGSAGGLQLYRPATDDFSLPARDSIGSIIPGNITQVLQDHNGTLRVCGNRTCDVRIIPGDELLFTYNPFTYKVDLTQCMVEDLDGVFWICQKYKEIYRLFPDGTIERLEEEGQGISSSMLCLGKDGAIYMVGERPGLYRYNKQTQHFDLVSDPSDKFVAIALKNTSDGRLLVGTDGNGLLEFDYKTDRLIPYYYDSYQLTPSTQKVHAILEDSNHSLWLGLFQKGVIATTSQMVPFRYIGHKTELRNGIGDKCVTSIARTRDGNVWVSTDNGGIYCIDGEGTPICQYPYSHGPHGVPQAVMSLFEDHAGRLWFGAYNRGLGTIDRNTGRCTYVPVRGESFSTNIYGFAEDHRHRLWATSMGVGPMVLDEAHHEMVPVNAPDYALWSGSIMFHQASRHLFFGTYNGLTELDPDDPDYKTTHHLGGYIIHSVSTYDSTTLCLSTDSGLLLYNFNTRETQAFTTAEGLPSNAICAAAVVSPSEIWVSCNRGLSRLRLPQGDVSNYTIYDGLQSNEFYMNAFMDEADGMLWFGGMEGITFFNPKEVEKRDMNFKVRITEHLENTIQMAVVPLLFTHRARYSYSLDGKTWISLPHGTNTVALPTLGSGTHKFRYKASVDGVESAEQVLQIFVPRPWYFQWWFVLICVFILTAAMVEGTLHLHQRRRDRKRLAHHEQLEAINDAKLSLFTNISHEIRTPMTLIVSPLERLLSEDPDSQHQHTYKLMQRNANRILGLINELLDLRKLDKNQMQLLCAETELSPYIEELVQNFSDVAEMRQQKLTYSSTAAPGLKGWIDINNFDKIVVNLLSNALKYTPQQGTIEVQLSQKKPSAQFPEGSFVITVTDSGMGIAPEDRKHIFERFYQVKNSKGKYGTGIGLHLTRMLVMMHHGVIIVGDNPAGEGTLFEVTIPLGNAHLSAEQQTTWTTQTPAGKTDQATETSTIAAASLSDEKEDIKGARHLTRKRVLLVDDDDEIRSYLCKQLSEFYYVSLCSNGREAFEMILKQAPDLVISDVMMPEMDGNELCSRIRSNVLVSHLPVILLTARSRQEDLIQGLDVGADAYLPKPFNIDVLLKTAQSVIRNHERLKNAYSGQQNQSSNVEVVMEPSPDERLMERINRILTEHIDDPSLSAEMVADMVGLSRVHLYRKLKELTNQSAREYIRNMRIIKAAEMLSSKKVAIGEVAAKVGYTDQRNFSTAFKSIYGMTPTEYMEKHIG